MTALLDTPTPRTPLGRRDRAMLELFYASGLRLSELVGVDLEDLNLTRASCACWARAGRSGSCRSTSAPPTRSARG